jgi:hypothetical protein
MFSDFKMFFYTPDSWITLAQHQRRKNNGKQKEYQSRRTPNRKISLVKKQKQSKKKEGKGRK